MGKLSTFVLGVILAIAFILAITFSISSVNNDTEDSYASVRSHHSDVKVFFNTLLGEGIGEMPTKAKQN